MAWFLEKVEGESVWAMEKNRPETAEKLRAKPGTVNHAPDSSCPRKSPPYHGVTMHKLIYVLACIFVPLAWGLAVAVISRRIDEWAKHRRPNASGNLVNPDDATRIEYHI
jgi:hypothetical protein